MKATRAWQPSFRCRLLLYLAGLAAVAVPWGYLLFIGPQRHVPRADAADADGRP